MSDWVAGRAFAAFGNGAFEDRDAEHLQFAMNPRCTPQRIGGRHSFDQSANLGGRSGPTSPPAIGFRQPGPESAKPFALPADDGVSLDID